MVADFNKKGNRGFFSKELLFKTIGILFLIVALVLIIADFRIYQRKQELTSQIDSYKKQIEDIKKSSQDLENEIANSDNTDYLEKIAYEQLGEARPGETVYSFVSSPKKNEAIQTPQNFWETCLGQVSGAWQWIKNKF